MDKLNSDIILAANPWLSGVKIKSESVSTQIDAKTDGQANTLYLSERQSGIYGRFGRQYFASPSGGIYMSLLLKPTGSFEVLPQYTLLTAAATVSAIEKLTDKKPLIKWVNDIYLNDKKIVGILTEASSAEGQITEIIIGIGINFQVTDFPDKLSDKAASLFDGTPTITRSQLIAEIWAEFDRLSKGDFFSLYKSHSFILGKQVSFVQNLVKFDGVAEDLTEQGELIVRLANGKTKVLSSGEISLKSWH